MRITSKGQVTIPIRIREKAGLMPNTEVEFAYEGGGVVRVSRLGKTKAKGRGSKKPTRGERLVARLRGSGDIKMTTDDIMKLMRGDPA